MRAAQGDYTGAIPQQGPKYPMDILTAGPQFHPHAQESSPKRLMMGFQVNRLKLGEARYTGEDCLADCGQESNHGFEVVDPIQIKEENNVWPGLSQAFDQLWQIRPCPIIHDRMHNNVLPGGGDTPFPAQDVHIKSCFRQKLTEV
jgi:hypothetical protein